MEEEQKKQLDRQMEEACLKVEMEMETAAHEYQAMLLRQGTSDGKDRKHSETPVRKE